MPLERRVGQLRSTSNVHSPAYAALAADDEARRALAEHLFGSGVPRIALHFVNANGLDVESWRLAADAARYRRRARTLERSPYIPIEGSWEAYESGLAGHRLREVRRRRRGLSRIGAVSLDVQDGRARLSELLAEGFRVEAAGWKGERGTAILRGADTLRFYEGIARWAADKGWLRLAFLRLDGRAIAFDYAIEQEGVHSLLKTGFDPEFRRYAPGILMREAMIRRSFSLRQTRYEFLGADEPWKLEWAGDVDDRISFQAFGRTPLGLIQLALYGYAAPVVLRALGSLRR